MASFFSSIRTRGWSGLFGLLSFEALAALLYLASLPADAENSLVLGFSLRRLALMAALTSLLAACGLLAWWSTKPAFCERWLNPARRRTLFNVLILALPLGLGICIIAPVLLMSLYHTGGDFRFLAYYQRLLPLIIWAGLFCLQGTLWLAWVGEFPWQNLRYLRGSFRTWLVICVIFALAWIGIAWTKIGLKPDIVGWGAPAVPLLEWQVWGAFLAGGLFLLGLLYRRWPARGDWYLAGAIWLLAAGLWLSQPVHTAYFATAGRAPNYEIYPFSDGAYYGLFAQSVLIGNGFEGDQVPPRPLYIALLAGFHAVAGQDYSRVIFVQTLLLACLPVVLYLIGKQLHSRPAGLVIALLTILRELTAILTVAITNKASTSQLFFADLPSALAISLWALAAVVWLKSLGAGSIQPFLAGGAMGLAMLFRTQSVFMLPLVALSALPVLRWRWGSWLRQMVILCLGLGLVIAPWLWRNWQVTGQLAFDDPKTQTGVMAQRYNLSDSDTGAQYAKQPGEDMQAYSQRVNQGLIGFMLSRPGVVAGFASAHLVNAEIDNLLLLPVRNSVAQPGDLFVPSQPFWESWAGSPTPGQALLMAINLALIALGIAAAWARLRWAGLALVLMNVAYNGSNALARNSGWRYLLSADWTVTVYIGLGLAELAVIAALVLGVSPVALAPHLAFRGEAAPGRAHSGWRARWAFPAAALALLLLGSMLPLVERAAPKRYPAQTEREIKAELLQSSILKATGLPADQARALVDRAGVQLIKGRALYPRFYGPGEGEPRTAKTGYEPLNYARTLFLIASNSYYGLVMVRANTPPANLPNAADVIVIGCMRDKYLDADAVLVMGSPGGLYLSGSRPSERCEPEPGTIP